MLEGRAEDHRSSDRGASYAGDPPLAPFHWEIEFPEVFDRDNPGFDAFVGNPPFLGGKRISTVISRESAPLPQGLAVRRLIEGANRNTDLSCRALLSASAFHLVRRGRNARPDRDEHDRSGGYPVRRPYGGSVSTAAQIYDATRRYKWPGQAAVVVSVDPSLDKETSPVSRNCLNGRSRPAQVTAFLFRLSGGHARIRSRSASQCRTSAFNGMFRARGMGFTFDDTDRERRSQFASRGHAPAHRERIQGIE